MDELTTIRLEVNLSKLAMLRALDDRNEDLKKMVADAMDRAIPEIRKQIDEAVFKATMTAVQSAVDDAAEDAVERLSEETAEKLSVAIEKAMRKKFEL